VLVDVDDVALGHMPVMRWNPPDKWITSQKIAHEPLISDEVFTAARNLLGSRAHKPAAHKPHRTRHPYLFKSLLYCAVCQRRMQGQHSHQVAYYRCRYHPTTPWPTGCNTPRTSSPCAKTWPSSRSTIELLAHQICAEVQPAVAKQRAAASVAAQFDKKIGRYKQASTREPAPPS
jgi:site-specific DNA recombinase